MSLLYEIRNFMKSSLIFLTLLGLVIWKYHILVGFLIGIGGTMFAFLLAYGFWELGLLGLILWGIITALVENEHGAWAVVTLVAALIGYNYAAKVHLLTLVKDHIWLTLFYLFAYFALGIIWSFFKWALYVKKRLNDYNTVKEQYLRALGEKTLTPKLVPGFKKALQGYRYSLEEAPEVKAHSDDLVRWASFWPWSVFWFLLNNPIRRAYESAFRLFHGALQGISDGMFAHVGKELNPEVVNDEPLAPPENVKTKKGA